MESIKLDLIPGKKMPSLHASQYDDGREHGIDLFENGIAYKLDGTETLTINERKVDNNICSMDIENTFSDSNHIVFASTEQMCAVWGNNICELVIAKGEKTIGTLNFILEIEQSPTEGGIESESEIRNLKTQVEAITEEVIGDDYYTAEQTDNAIATAIEGKADTTYVDTELAKKADKTDTYTKTQVDTIANRKMDRSNPSGTGNISVGSNMLNIGSNSQTFGSNTKALGNNAFATGENTQASVANQFVFGKYNQYSFGNLVEIVGNGTSESNRSNARTLDWQGNETLAGNLTFNGNKSLTGEISRLDGRIDDLPESMVFKGTLGVGGTIESLPTASAENEGWMFKCITAGTYAGLTLKVGDTVTCFNPPNTSTYYWDKTGSQDTDTDTWRNIKVNGVEKLGNGISSGAVDFEDTANVKFEFDANGNKVRARLDGIYTESEVDELLDDKADADNTYTKEQVDDIVSDAIYNVLPDDTASGSVANFTTSLELPIKSLEVDVNAVQESGTPTPQSPKAISGVSSVSVYHRGFNLFDKTTVISGEYINDTDGTARNDANSKRTDYIEIAPDTNYYTKSEQTQGNWGAWYDANKNFIAGINGYNAIRHSPVNARYARLTCYRGGSGNIDTFCFNVSDASKNGQYEAYNGTTALINLGGTYYGGHLTQDKAGHRQLTITYGVADISELSWNRFNFSGVYCFYVNIPLMKTNYAKGLSSAFEFVRNVYNPNALANNQFLLDNGTHNGYCYLRCDDYSDVATFKTAMAGQKLIYELATPIIIDLPDGEPIITINGTNNIYADTGDCAVEYKCSVAEYVANHSGGGGAKSLGGVFLGGSNSGSEEEPTEENEETEKTKELDEPKEEIKTIGDMKKLGGE